jgi:plasmid maintenance system antidote protein VapI
MLTEEDILKLSQVFGTKEDMKEIVENLSTKADFINLQTSVDAYAKKADSYFTEMVALSHKVDRHEKWLHLVADKLGVKLEY